MLTCLFLTGSMSFPPSIQNTRCQYVRFSGSRELRFLRNFFEFLCVPCVCFVFGRIPGYTRIDESIKKRHGGESICGSASKRVKIWQFAAKEKGPLILPKCVPTDRLG